MGVVHIAVRGGRKRCIRGAYVENSGVVLNNTVTKLRSTFFGQAPDVTCQAARPAWTSTSGRRMGS